MRVYIGTPCNQLQAHLVSGHNVLVSFGAYSPWLSRGGYMASFGRLLLDSGAYSELNSGKKIDIVKYMDWVQLFPYADAHAGLDDIRGDYRRSLRHYEYGGFPTMHDADPDELLPDLIDIAKERGNWIGIGLMPPRSGREDWLRRTIDRIPEDMHIHGWALGAYAHIPRLSSFDSCHAWLEWQKIRNALPFLTSGEAMELAVTKVRRQSRMIEKIECKQGSLALVNRENETG